MHSGEIAILGADNWPKLNFVNAALRKPSKCRQKIFAKIHPSPKFDEEVESGVILPITVVKMVIQNYLF